MKRLSIIPLAILAFAPLTGVTAQQPPPVKVGDRVRVTAPDVDVHRYTGQLVAVQRDNLTVDTLTVVRASITRLEVQRGRKTNALKGASIGALSLGLAGVGLGIGACRGFSDVCTSEGEWAAIGGAIGVAVGGLIGLGLGAFTKTDRWEEVSLDRLRVSFVPHRDGRFVLGLSVRF